jgi:hypothetical protein
MQDQGFKRHLQRGICGCRTKLQHYANYVSFDALIISNKKGAACKKLQRNSCCSIETPFVWMTG